MTVNRRGQRAVSRLYWALLIILAVAAGIGGARLYRASLLLAPMTDGLSSDVPIDNALELTRRVADRFRSIDAHGPLGNAAPWPLRTEADYLLSGGDCGGASGALAALFVSQGRRFRILQANVGPQGAGHIMVETPDDSGRWVLLDPLAGHGFPSPRDGRLLGIDEIRELPAGERDWLTPQYVDGDLSLFSPYRRTNWARLGPFADVIRALKGDDWMRETSLRAAIIRSDRWLTIGAVAALLIIGIVSLFARRRSAAMPLAPG